MFLNNTFKTQPVKALAFCFKHFFSTRLMAELLVFHTQRPHGSDPCIRMKKTYCKRCLHVYNIYKYVYVQSQAEFLPCHRRHCKAPTNPNTVNPYTKVYLFLFECEFWKFIFVYPFAYLTGTVGIRTCFIGSWSLELVYKSMYVCIGILGNRFQWLVVLSVLAFCWNYGKILLWYLQCNALNYFCMCVGFI